MLCLESRDHYLRAGSGLVVSTLRKMRTLDTEVCEMTCRGVSRRRNYLRVGWQKLQLSRQDDQCRIRVWKVRTNYLLESTMHMTNLEPT